MAGLGAPTPPPSPVRGGGAAPFVWAHRGASALAPENTLRSFLLAAELGAPGIELDVRLTRDGVPLVLHDPWLWTDGEQLLLRPEGVENGMRRVLIAESSWADLEGRPVTHRDGSREAVPRFEEVLEAVPDRLWLDVELKAGWGYDPRLCGVVAAALKRRPERVLASSFDHVILRELGALAPSVDLLAICHARPADLAALLAPIPARMVSIDRAFLLAEDVVRWQEEGFEVGIGGQELLLDLPEVLTWPVASVFLDDPRLAGGSERGGAW